MKVVIVGGVAGGATAAARLRRLDEKAEIIILERGQYVSFANCGLPYYIGGVITDKRNLTLQTPQSFKERFNIDVRVNSEVTAIDTSQKCVTVSCDGKTYTESYDKLLLSTGAEPFVPKMEGVDLQGVFTLRNVPDALTIKSFIDSTKAKTALVVGGGYIGIETAENLAHAGLMVTVVERAPHLIAPLDFDMACDVYNYVTSKGVNVLCNAAVNGITKQGKSLVVDVDGKAHKADMVLLSVGVRPESQMIGKAGIALNERGFVKVDSQMRTNVQDVYCVGDVTEIDNFVTGKKTAIALAGPANKQGRIAADNICGIQSKYDGAQGSSVLKLFDMTVATTGINERQAVAEGIAYDKVLLYSGSHAGYYPNATNMSLKVLWEKQSGKLLGAQIVGFDGVDKRMDVLACTIRLGSTIQDLTRLELCYAPPFGSAKDPVNMAGYVAENINNGLVKQCFAEQLKQLVAQDNAVVLDVRTDYEVATGRIAGSVHIPLDSLRARINELDKSKKIYVHCHSGLRSYIAARILSANGFDCCNVAGGFRLLQSLHHAFAGDERFSDVKD